MKITLEMLREKNACSEGMDWVAKNIPALSKGGCEYREFIEKLESSKKREWADWLIGNFEVLVLAEKWRIDALLDSAKGAKGKLNDEGGDYAQIGSSGDYAQIGSSGYSAKIGSSGDYAKIGSSGYSAKIGSSGYSAKIGSSGDYAQIGSSGYSAKIGSSGDYAQIGSSGYSAKIGSSGYSAKIGSSGDSAQIGSSGDSAQIGSSGDSAQIEATGKKSILAAVGYDSIAKAGEDGCIALAWFDRKANRPRLAIGYVGEDGIKPDTWYRAENGKLVEVEKAQP